MNAALAKHLEYYNRIYYTEEYVYVIASIFDSFKKMIVFDDKSWKDDITDWKTLYKIMFKEIFTYYQTLYSDIKCWVAQWDHLTSINYLIQYFKRYYILCDDASITEKIKQYINKNK